MKAPSKGESSPLLLLPLHESPKPKQTARLKEICKYISAKLVVASTVLIKHKCALYKLLLFLSQVKL